MDFANEQKFQVVELTRQLTAAMISKNIQVIDKILDPLFTLTHITGYVQSKEEWLAEIETELMKYYSCQELKTSVMVNGNKATFVGQNLLDARIWGTRNTWHLQQTMFFKKQGENWIILNSIATTF